MDVKYDLRSSTNLLAAYIYIYILYIVLSTLAQVWRQHFHMLHFGGGSLKPTIIWTNRREVADSLALPSINIIYRVGSSQLLGVDVQGHGSYFQSGT